MPEFFQSELFWVIIAYLIMSIVIAYEGEDRGWEPIGVFVICIIASPIVGAILYSHYKKEVPKKADEPLPQTFPKEGEKE
jgi:hypothetical protein